MAKYFFDTSAYVKHFHLEAGSERIDELVADTSSRRFISQLGAAEIISALAIKVRVGEIGDAQLLVARKQLFNEIGKQQVEVVRVLSKHYRAAQQLLLKHAVAKRLRTADAIQLAIAIEISQSRNVEFFVCADRVLCDVARSEGLATIDPLHS
jgi:predicted nucleic acid-binding protein